ncbi:MAG: DinB family protein [Acidobacteriota bacterium]
MTLELSSSINLLRRTPPVLDALLRDTDPAVHRTDEGPDTWSPIVVVGHLIHGEETDWIPRARLILEAAEKAAPPPRFEPYDRFAQFERFGDWSLDRLLDRFAELRRDNLATLAGWSLTESHFALPGEHPELGPVTLGNLLAAWVVHDLGHIVQISRVMAKTYTGEVGPWPEYLTVLGVIGREF